MKNKKEFEKWCLVHLKKLQKILLLEHFHPLKFYFKNTQNEAIATCLFNYPYQSIDITYSKCLYESWEKKDYSHVKNVLTHEMCHPLTDPLYEKATRRYVAKDEILDEREKLTDHLANIILKNISL